MAKSRRSKIGKSQNILLYHVVNLVIIFIIIYFYFYEFCSEFD